MPLTTLVAGNTIAAATLNNNFGLCVLEDTSTTITVTHTWSASQTFSAGWTAAAACAITAASATAFAVGRQGTTDPVLLVHSSTASQATGIKITGAAAAGGVALAAISSGTNEALTIDAKGSGTITLGATSTGAITLTRATTISAALTYGGVTLSNAVTGTGNMVLSASPTLTGTAIAASLTLSGTLALAGATVSGTPTWSSSQAITLSTAAQPNVTSVGTLTSLLVGNTGFIGINNGTGIVLQDSSGALRVAASGGGAGGGARAAILAANGGFSNGITVTGAAGTFDTGITVSAGTTAVQALTATTGTFTGNGVFGSSLGIGAARNINVGNTGDNSSIAIGQSGTRALELYWVYNATAANAYGLIQTFAGSNNLVLQRDSGGVSIGTTTVAGAGALVVAAGITATTGTFSGDVQTSTWIKMAGTSSSFPAWKRNGTAIEARLADDSARADVYVEHLYANTAFEGIHGINSSSVVGFYGAAGSTKLTVSGSRGGNAALASLLTHLATLGLITDSSS